MRTAAFSLWALVLTGAILPPSANALIFGEDRRVTAIGDASHFRPIGIVFGTGESSYATGFLVDACHVLTVQHVFGSKHSAVGRPAYFAVGGPKLGGWQMSRGVVEAEGGLDRSADGPPSTQVRTSDWVLLRLQTCLGRRFGHVRLTDRMPAPEESISMAGYPGDKPIGMGVTLDPSCRVRAIQQLILFNDCSALPGNSGSPLFRIAEENGKRVLEVFAMMQRAHSKADLGYDQVARSDRYPLAMWNVAMAICERSSVASPRPVMCLGERSARRSTR
jgi:V8-like Glu-specific endopeptidase